MSRARDRQDRRQQVGAALLELAARDGLAGVSVRKVAVAAGCSAGAVQKYFTDSEQMLAFALDLAGERTLERLSAVDQHGPVRDVVRQWLLATLPLDRERRAEARIWVEFAARAAGHAPFARVLTETDQVVRAALADVLAQARDRGELAVEVPVATVAHALVAVTDGLAIQLLYDATDPDRAVGALDASLAALLPGPPPLTQSDSGTTARPITRS